MRDKIYLYDAITSNRRRIALGVLVFFLVILSESTLVAAIVTIGRTLTWRPFLLAFIIAFSATVVLFPLLACWAYYRGKRTILKLFRTVTPSESDCRKLRMALESVRVASGAGEIDVKVIGGSSVNAISLAKGYKEGLVLVTRGAVENMDRDELEALLAHEVSHIMSHDTWMWMLGLGVSVFLPLVLSTYFSGVGRAFDEDAIVYTRFFMREIFTISIMFLFSWLLLAVFWMPLWIAYFALVLPRNRDFLADSRALLITRDPDALVSALKKSDIMRSDAVGGGNVYINHMFFNQPLSVHGSFTGWLTRLLRAHPCVEERLERLGCMT